MWKAGTGSCKDGPLTLEYAEEEAGAHEVQPVLYLGRQAKPKASAGHLEINTWHWIIAAKLMSDAFERYTHERQHMNGS